MGVRRGAASPASAAGVNGGGGEVGEEDETRVEAWKAGREATTRLFYVRCSVEEFVEAARISGIFYGGGPVGLERVWWADMPIGMLQSSGKKNRKGDKSGSFVG